jgi:hypothetical protein
MSVAAIATEIIRRGTAVSVSDRGVDTNRRNPAPSLQDDVHRETHLAEATPSSLHVPRSGDWRLR